LVNQREYLKGRVRLTTPLVSLRCHIPRALKYDAIDVGTPVFPYEGEPALLIRLPDDTVLNIAADDAAAQVKARMPWPHYPSEEPDWLTEDTRAWPDGTLEISVGPWKFFTRDERIIGLRVCRRTDDWPWRGSLPAVGLPSDGRLFELPLKPETVVAIFGPPDLVRHVFY